MNAGTNSRPMITRVPIINLSLGVLCIVEQRLPSCRASISSLIHLCHNSVIREGTHRAIEVGGEIRRKEREKKRKREREKVLLISNLVSINQFIFIIFINFQSVLGYGVKISPRVIFCNSSQRRFIVYTYKNRKIRIFSPSLTHSKTLNRKRIRDKDRPPIRWPIPRALASS